MGPYCPSCNYYNIIINIMKKLLLFLIAILTLTGCEKRFGEIESDIAVLRAENADQRNQIYALQTAINDLAAEIDSSNGDITANAEAIVAAEEAITDNLNLISDNSESTTASLTAILSDLAAVEAELVAELDAAVNDLNDAIQAGDADIYSDIENTIALLRSEIDAAQAAAEAYADLNDDDIVSNSNDLLIQITAIDAAFLSAVNDLQADINANTGSINSIIGELNDIDAEITQLNQRLASDSQQIGWILDSIGDIEGRLTTVSNTLSGLGEHTDVSGIEQSIKDLWFTIKEIKEDVDELLETTIEWSITASGTLSYTVDNPAEKPTRITYSVGNDEFDVLAETTVASATGSFDISPSIGTGAIHAYIDGEITVLASLAIDGEVASGTWAAVRILRVRVGGR